MSDHHLAMMGVLCFPDHIVHTSSKGNGVSLIQHHPEEHSVNFSVVWLISALKLCLRENRALEPSSP